MTATTTKTHLDPTEIAPETFLIHDHEGEGTAPVCVALNSMLIRGAEPVVVDTGMAENRDQYFADLFGLVEPEDIRWVFISHDDVDHTGNLNALMDAAPNATLVINRFMTSRMGESLQVPPSRQRWVGDGETLDVGDRAERTRQCSRRERFGDRRCRDLDVVDGSRGTCPRWIADQVQEQGGLCARCQRRDVQRDARADRGDAGRQGESAAWIGVEERGRLRIECGDQGVALGVQQRCLEGIGDVA